MADDLMRIRSDLQDLLGASMQVTAELAVEPVVRRGGKIPLIVNEVVRCMTGARLIVNADDFGMSRGITDGIILAHRYGFVTSASLMVNMPAAKYAVSQLASVTRLGVGVHLNITAGRPVLPAEEVPTLVDANGRFHGAAAMSRKLWQWRAIGSEIEAEFRAQIQWMKERGVTPTHADSHQHMHIYPAAIGPFIRSLAAEEIRCTRAPRSVAWPRNRAFGIRFDWGTARGFARAATVGATVSRLSADGGIPAGSICRIAASPSFRAIAATSQFLASGGNQRSRIFRKGRSNSHAIRASSNAAFRKTIPYAYCARKSCTGSPIGNGAMCLDRGGIQLISYRDLPAQSKSDGMTCRERATAEVRALR